jgi:type IV fimbrial biogenesis protein FimT
MQMNNTKGFTFLETMIVMTIVAILSVIVVPSLLSKMPQRHLKAAARELFSNLQKAKILAVKENDTMLVRFVSTGGGFYYLDANKNTNWDPGEKRVNLSTYKDVSYGLGSAVRNWKGERHSRKLLY